MEANGQDLYTGLTARDFDFGPKLFVTFNLLKSFDNDRLGIDSKNIRVPRVIPTAEVHKTLRNLWDEADDAWYKTMNMIRILTISFIPDAGEYNPFDKWTYQPFIRELNDEGMKIFGNKKYAERCEAAALQSGIGAILHKKPVEEPEVDYNIYTKTFDDNKKIDMEDIRSWWENGIFR